MPSSHNETDSLSQASSNSESVFNAPWEARAFAIVNQLAADQHYSWTEWTNVLSTEIATTEQQAPGSKAYYENWLAACEKLLVEKGLLASDAIDDKVAALIAEQEAEHDH